MQKLILFLRRTASALLLPTHGTMPCIPTVITYIGTLHDFVHARTYGTLSLCKVWITYSCLNKTEAWSFEDTMQPQRTRILETGVTRHGIMLLHHVRYSIESRFLFISIGYFQPHFRLFSSIQTLQHIPFTLLIHDKKGGGTTPALLLPSHHTRWPRNSLLTG